MNIKTAVEGAVVTVSVSGRIDTTTSPALEQELKGRFDNCEELILDFAEVEYISSAGLRVLLMAHKTMSRKKGMTLKNVGPEIMEIFDVTGFSDILAIE